VTTALSPEAAALHAVIEGDDAEARRVLEGLMHGELLQLYGHASRLAELAHDVRANQCDRGGPRVGAEGAPHCVLRWDHDGPHRAHESWGEVTW
jgi:hypothetical protein